jgi:hypothetical protein
MIDDGVCLGPILEYLYIVHTVGTVHVRFGSDLEYILQVVVPSRPAAVYLLLLSILVFFGMRMALPPRKLITAGQAEIWSKKSISMVVPRKVRHYCQPPCKDHASL